VIPVLLHDIAEFILESGLTSVLTRTAKKLLPGGQPSLDTKIITLELSKKPLRQQLRFWHFVRLLIAVAIHGLTVIHTQAPGRPSPLPRRTSGICRSRLAHSSRHFLTSPSRTVITVILGMDIFHTISEATFTKGAPVHSHLQHRCRVWAHDQPQTRRIRTGTGLLPSLNLLQIRIREQVVRVGAHI